jgi:hypothetical protein
MCWATSSCTAQSVPPRCTSCCVLPAQACIVCMLTHRLVFAVQIILNGRVFADFFTATARTPTRSGREPTQLTKAALATVAVTNAGRAAYLAPHESESKPCSAHARTSGVRHCSCYFCQSMSSDDMSDDDLARQHNNAQATLRNYVVYCD